MIKEVKDYIPELKKIYPTVSESDLNKIINYGWRMFYIYTLFGCDFIAKQRKPNMLFYCGLLMNNSISWFNYYKFKLLKKLRVLFKNTKTDIYYTAISKELYAWLNENKRRTTIYTNNYIFKSLDAAKLYYTNEFYFIKLKYTCDVGLKYRKKNLKCSNVEIVYKRNSLTKLKDLLVSNNNYEII